MVINKYFSPEDYAETNGQLVYSQASTQVSGLSKEPERITTVQVLLEK